MNDPSKMTVEELYTYAVNVINKDEPRGKRWPEGEQYIMKDPFWAYWYTQDIINEFKNLVNPREYLGLRWLEAEPYIAQDPFWAYIYAKNVINKDRKLGIRWPEAEPYIMKEPGVARMYARDVAVMSVEELKTAIKNKINQI